MERIKQALELARQERIKNGGTVVGAIKATKSVHERVEDKDIKYTNTRTIAIYQMHIGFYEPRYYKGLMKKTGIR